MQDPIIGYDLRTVEGEVVSWHLGIGSGESGKSTIVKQMKIIHQNGYTIDELAMYRLTIYKNLVDCAKALVMALQKFDIEPVAPMNKVCLICLWVI